MTGVNSTKPQLFVDTVSIPKRKPKANNKPKSKRSKPSPRRQPKSSSAKHRPSKPRKPALTRQERKEQGLCRCNQPAIQGQTRCPTCAEKHRAWLRPYSEARRRARGAKPLQRISDADLLRLIQAEVDTRESQVADPSVREVHPDTHSLSRAQRKSLSICSDCDYPSEERHTRCTLCLLRRRLDSRRRRAKATARLDDSIQSGHGRDRRAPLTETMTVNHGGNRQEQPNPSPDGVAQRH